MMDSDSFQQHTFSATPESHTHYEADSLTSPSAPPTQTQGGNVPPHHLNPRSCVTCRKRKVRCNKVEPHCENCSKAGIDCIYPAPGRAPRKPRKPPDAELLKRLRRLEGVVQGLGAQVDENGSKSQSPPAVGVSRNNSIVNEACSSLEVGEHGAGGRDKVGDLPLGKLVISEGKSRYVNNSYWASIGNEIADIRDILDHSDSDDEDHNSPQQSHDWEDMNHRGFIFGFSSLAVDMSLLRPSPSQIFIIWEIFKENIDPVVKVLHCPSVRNLIMKAAVNMDTISRSAEALFFSICFGSIVSMNDDQCRSLLGDSKMVLFKKYRFATEQALARADFMNSSSLIVLQAFIFYLICVRFHDDSKSVWAMGGLAIQIGYTLGLHRDGKHFDLDPFETEMRRRLWWHIAILDIRAAEDHGTEIRTTQSTYDTQFPSNINDDDIWPGMTEPPTVTQGPTEMTMCLIRFELSAMARRLQLFSPVACSTSDEAIKAKELIIDECHRSLEDRYIRGCDMNIPIYWVAATVSRLILAKMWLKLHHPRLSKMGLQEHPELRDRVFTTSIEVIEFGHLLESNENTAKWGWLFRTYMQWHAVAYVMSELCTRPPSSVVDRAWRAVESVYDESEQSKKQRGMLWKPIRQLMIKARAHRAQYEKATVDLNNGTTLDDNRWMTGQRSVVAQTAEALGLDLGDVGMMDQLSDPMESFGIGYDEAGIMNGLPQEPAGMSPLQALQTQGSTPDYFSWDGWSPGVGGFSVGAPVQTFQTDYDKPQEWF